MAKQKIAMDWKMAIGFGGLLSLIVVIGLIGIQQIQGLRKVVEELANRDMPMQNAVVEMKSSNSKYAMGIRSYMFWRSTKYLGAAAMGEKLDFVRSASKDFNKQMELYLSLSPTELQRVWMQVVRLNHARLQEIGENMIHLSNQMGDAANLETKKDLQEAVNRQLMDFESQLFNIDRFLDSPVQEYSRFRIDKQLVIAEAGRRHAIIFMTWSLLIGLFLGVQTASLIFFRSRQEKERRDLLTRRVIKVEEEERNNLSLQIHDQMGQDLSALKIYLGLIENDLPLPMTEERAKIEKTKKILDSLMEKTHNISELLRPPELDDLGLVESIAALILHYKEMTKCEYHFHRPAADFKLSPETSLMLYRIIQEALTNVAKYSNANRVEISLENIPNSISLIVMDNGAGFDYNEFLKKPARRKEDKMKLGLQGLKERVELLGGRFRINAKPGQGTRLEVTLPAVD